MSAPSAASPVPNVSCPVCRSGRIPVGPGPVSACPACGHESPTGWVADAASLDVWLSDSTRRRAWLDDRIAHGTGPPAPAAQTGGAYPGHPAYPPKGASGRSVLFALGGVLLALAGLSALALAWTRLSPEGRALLIAAVAAGFIVIGDPVRKRAPGAAETFTGVGVVLGTAALLAAPSLFGVAQDWWQPGHPGLLWGAWCAVVFVVVTAGTLLLARARPTVRAWSVVAPVAATGAVWSVAVVASAVPGPGEGAAYRQTLMAAFVGLGAALMLLGSRIVPPRELSGVLWRALAWSSGGLAAVLAVAVDPESGPAAAGGVILAALGLVPYLARRADRSLASKLVAQLAAGLGLGGGIVFVAVSLIGANAALPLLSLSAAGLLASVTYERVALPFAGPFVAVTGASSIVTSLALGAGWASVVFGLWALVTALVALTSWERPPFPTRHLAWLSAAFGSTAWWAALSLREYGGPLEVFVVPPGVLTLLLGVAWAWRDRSATGVWPSTAASLMPGLLFLGVPGAILGAVEAAGGTSLLRGSAYLLLAALVTAGGARAGLVGPFVAGVVVTVLAAAGLLGAVGRAIPGWLVLAAAGAVLVGVALRWEWVQDRRRVGTDWVRGLH